MPPSNSPQPPSNDRSIEWRTGIFFALTFAGFVLLSVVIGVGVFWGLLMSAVITFLSQAAWQSSVGAHLVKRFFTKSLWGFLKAIFRERSFHRAAKEMLSSPANLEKEIEETVQRESRGLAIIPALLLTGTGILDLLLDASLRYFLIAECYYFLVGFAWMRLCRKGRLTLLPIPLGDS